MMSLPVDEAVDEAVDKAGLGTARGALFGTAVGVARLNTAEEADETAEEPRPGTIEDTTSSRDKPAEFGEDAAGGFGEDDAGGLASDAGRAGPSAGMMPVPADDELSRIDPFFEMLESFFELEGDFMGDEETKSRPGMIAFSG